MWIRDQIFKEDLEAICADRAIPWEKLNGKRIFVTGGTGLIGSTLISALLYYGMDKSDPPHVVALVRDLKRAKKQFAEQQQDCPGCLEFVVGEVQGNWQVNGNVDYVVHGASQTASKAFAQNPVETIQTAVFGTNRMLQLAFEKQAKSFVYLSSMEVYGAIEEKYLAEQDLGFIDPLAVRSCYPESKRMCENLCVSYVSEYNVPAKICRLAQTFGRGVDIEKDVRVLSYFLRCAKENTDIELKTLGKSKRMCLYTMDAVAALLIILLKGEPGKAYNAANEETYSSILETAELVKNEIAETEIEIKYPRIVSEEALHNYPPEYKIRLNCGALCELGWKARYSMIDILRRSM